MYSVRSVPSPSLPRDVAMERRGAVAAVPRLRRERDFGTGYGKSSGYAATDRRYAPTWRQAGFRCA